MKALLRSVARITLAAALAAASLTAEIRTLTILHVNDLHARLLPLENRHGGFAFLASLIRREREKCADCILLNAGDVAQGTPVSTIFHASRFSKWPTCSASTPPASATTISITAGC